MTGIEHRLRQELKTQAERISPAQLRPLAAPRSRSQSRARRWLAPLGTAAAVAVVIVGVALAVAWQPSPPVPVSVPRPAPSGGPPSRPAADPPAFAVALVPRTGGPGYTINGPPESIKLLSPVTGQIVRSVAAGGGGNGFALSPDSRSVYVVGPVKGQTSIERISVATGQRSFIADGAQPAVSPDGSYLAYATGRLFTKLAIRDLRTGTTRVISLGGLIGADSGLLNGQVTWLGDGTQVVAMPAAFGTAVAGTPSPSPTAAARNSCGHKGASDRLCLVVIDLAGGHPRARRVFVSGAWGQPLISGDLAAPSTLLLAMSLVSRPEIGAAAISAAGVSMQRLAVLPPDALAEAFAPGGDRILYLRVSRRGHPQPALWVATISGGRLAGAHALFTDNSKLAFNRAAW